MEQNVSFKEKLKGLLFTSGDFMLKGAVCVLTLVLAVCCVFLIPSSSTLASEKITKEIRYFDTDVAAEIYNVKSDVLVSITDIKKVHTLPLSEAPAPKPLKNCMEYNDKGKLVRYSDETITVEYWTERYEKSNAHFAKIQIAHPSQLRTAFADGKYGTSSRFNTKKIARQVNAVIATNGDFYNYRTTGIVIRQGVKYRNKPHGWDVLFIDKKGDFHICGDNSKQAAKYYKGNDIANTLHFGPSLVVDGKIKLLHPGSGCGETWNEKASPRTAIGQLGELTYLMCCVEGRTDESRGVSVSKMAKLMASKGCIQAYELDGGQSTAMVFCGELMNTPLWGGMRAISDIVYFATALDS